MVCINSKKQQPSFSEYISDFITATNNAIKDYNHCVEEVNRLDKLTQDYLHMLELGGLNYKERAKIATKLKNARQERRGYKDVIQVLTPFYNFYTDSRTAPTLRQLGEVLGKTRKAERSLDYRVYVPRVLDVPMITIKTARKPTA